MTSAKERQLEAIRTVLPDGSAVGACAIAVEPILKTGAMIGVLPENAVERSSEPSQSPELTRAAFLSSTAAIIEIVYSSRVGDFCTLLMESADSTFVEELRRWRDYLYVGKEPDNGNWFDEALPAYLSAWDWVNGMAPDFARASLAEAFPESIFTRGSRISLVAAEIFEYVMSRTDSATYTAFLDGTKHSRAWSEMVRPFNTTARATMHQSGSILELVPSRDWQEMVDLHRRIETLLSLANSLEGTGRDFHDAARGPAETLHQQLRANRPDPLRVQQAVFDLSRLLVAQSANSNDESIARLSAAEPLFQDIEGESAAMAAIRAVDAAALLINLSSQTEQDDEDSEATSGSQTGRDILASLGWIAPAAVASVGVGIVVGVGAGSIGLAIASSIISTVSHIWSTKRDFSTRHENRYVKRDVPDS